MKVVYLRKTVLCRDKSTKNTFSLAQRYHQDSQAYLSVQQFFTPLTESTQKREAVIIEREADLDNGRHFVNSASGAARR